MRLTERRKAGQGTQGRCWRCVGKGWSGHLWNIFWVPRTPEKWACSIPGKIVYEILAGDFLFKRPIPIPDSLTVLPFLRGRFRNLVHVLQKWAAYSLWRMGDCRAFPLFSPGLIASPATPCLWMSTFLLGSSVTTQLNPLRHQLPSF